MRITRSRVCLVGLICTVALAFVPLNAAEEGGGDEQLKVIVYPVADLPVWRCNSDTFNPTLLIDSLNALVAHGGQKKASIAVHKTTSSLVILDTESNHQKIIEYISRFRRGHPDEEIEVNASFEELIEALRSDDVK